MKCCEDCVHDKGTKKIGGSVVCKYLKEGKHYFQSDACDTAEDCPYFKRRA